MGNGIGTRALCGSDALSSLAKWGVTLVGVKTAKIGDGMCLVRVVGRGGGGRLADDADEQWETAWNDDRNGPPGKEAAENKLVDLEGCIVSAAGREASGPRVLQEHSWLAVGFTYPYRETRRESD